MNWNTVGGEWKQIKSVIKSKWAKLTDDDIAAVEAKRDALVGRLQERYGILRDEAERQVNDLIAQMGRRTPSKDEHDTTHDRPR